MRKNYQGKRVLNGAPAHKSHGGKRALGGPGRTGMTLLSLALVLLLTVGGTLAWVTARTETITNTFEMGSIVPEIKEDFDNRTKENVYVTNNGSVPAYVRVALVYTWRDDATPGKNPDNTGTIVAEPVDVENDLSIVWGSDKWLKGTDGYYYYTEPVGAGEETKKLISSLSVKGTSENGKLYNLDVQILVDAIQAEPVKAVTETWGVTVVDGIITGSAAVNP